MRSSAHVEHAPASKAGPDWSRTRPTPLKSPLWPLLAAFTSTAIRSPLAASIMRSTSPPSGFLK